MKNTIVKDALILFGITLAAGLLLGLVHEVTLEPIAQAQMNAAQETYIAVYPDAAGFEEDAELTALCEKCSQDPEIQKFGKNVTVDGALKALDAQGNVIGYIINSSAKGYGGPVRIAVGISSDNVIKGLGFLSLSETPGLGMRVKEESFTSQFPGKTADENIELNAISGATKTSNAVKGGLKAAVYLLNNYIK